MWLFDEILKKPSETTASATGGGSSGTTGDDATTPVVKIEKSEGESLFAWMQESKATPEVAVTEQEIKEEVVISSEIPEVIPSLIVTDVPVLEASEGEKAENSESSILEVSKMPQASILTTEESQINETSVGVEEALQETKEETSSSILDMTANPSKEDVVQVETPLFQGETESISFGEESKAPIEAVSEVVHPKDFLSDSLIKVEAMIASIEEAHGAKISEATGYKEQKEHFAELEEKAHAEAEKMLEEKAHAERMKTYFEEEMKNDGKVLPNKEETVLERTEESSSVIGTTLTTLAVQTNVEEVSKVPEKPAEAVETKKEESPLMMMLEA